MEGTYTSAVRVSDPELPDIISPEYKLLIGLPQSLFKIHPDFDLILEEIMLRSANSRLVLLEGNTIFQTAEPGDYYFVVTDSNNCNTIITDTIKSENINNRTLLDTEVNKKLELNRKSNQDRY